MKNTSTHGIFLLICLCTIVNGSVFWMHRTGLLEKQTLEHIISEKRSLEKQVIARMQKATNLSDSEIDYFSSKSFSLKTKLTTFLYSIPEWLIVTKALKYLGIIILVIAMFIKHPSLKYNIESWSMINKVFFCYLMFTMIVIVSKGRFNALLAAGYSYSFIVVALLCAPLANQTNRKLLAKYASYLLAVLLLFCLHELFFGVQIFSNHSVFKKRLVGYMNQPNTMGIFVVCISSYIASACKEHLINLRLVCYLLVVGLLIIMSDSTMAMMLSPILVYQLLSPDSKRYWKIIVFGAAIMIVLTLMYDHSTINSLTGRLEKFNFYFAAPNSLFDYLFGHGPGTASNSLALITRYFSLTSTQIFYATDSTPLLLISEIGFIGCFLFYLMLFEAMILDSQLRLAYITIILSSLSLNIIEIFPLNLLLGLMLAKRFLNSDSNIRIKDISL